MSWHASYVTSDCRRRCPIPRRHAPRRPCTGPTTSIVVMSNRLSTRPTGSSRHDRHSRWRAGFKGIAGLTVIAPEMAQNAVHDPRLRNDGDLCGASHKETIFIPAPHEHNRGTLIAFRAHPHGTFKFLFNGIYYGNATPVKLDWSTPSRTAQLIPMDRGRFQAGGTFSRSGGTKLS